MDFFKDNNPNNFQFLVDNKNLAFTIDFQLQTL